MGGFVAQELALATRRECGGWGARSHRPQAERARGRERLRVSLALRERDGLLEAYYRDLFLWILDDATYARPGAVERLVRAAVAAAADEPLDGIRGQVRRASTTRVARGSPSCRCPRWWSARPTISCTRPATPGAGGRHPRRAARAGRGAQLLSGAAYGGSTRRWWRSWTGLERRRAGGRRLAGPPRLG
jgi:hypothetical protein